MAQAIRSEHSTPADELRRLLSAAEDQLPHVKGSGAQVVDFLLGLDDIADLWPQVEAMGADLRPEAGRWETTEALVHKQGPTIVREIGAAGGFEAARARYHPDGQAEWWWQLDREVQQNRIQRIRKAVLTLLVIVIIGAVALVVINRVIPTDPLYQAAFSKQMTGQRLIEDGKNYPGAIQAFQEATVLTPNDAEPWLWLGVTQKKIGDSQAAEKSFARARSILGKDLELYIQRGMILSGIGLLDDARADIDAALKIDPEEPRAWLYLANIQESQGQLGEAIKSLERASEMSEKHDQPQLTAITRYRLAVLYQQFQGESIRPPTPTPTPSATSTPGA
jgi:tetratricopeptide (TPR) repeat protein